MARETKRKLIRNKAVELIKDNPSGMRYTELQHELQSCFPNVSPNTIVGSTWNLDITRAKEIYKPTRGLYKYRLAEEEIKKPDEIKSLTFKEEDFYGPFADWLTNDLGECTVAVALGSSSLGKKWGTPDVIGVYRPSKRDLIQFHPEIISAEVKLNPSDPVTAFGQSIAYRLFSSKSYLVEPKTISKEDYDRLEALCILFGVGLILFDIDLKNPNFEIRVRAQRYVPDMFYVNQFADKLYNTNRNVFDKLF